MQRYKVIEVSPVDETTIEKALNTWYEKGWEFDRIEFVQQPGVRRPVFAYVFLVALPRSHGDVEQEDQADSDLDG